MQGFTVNVDWEEFNQQFACFINSLELRPVDIHNSPKSKVWFHKNKVVEESDNTLTRLDLLTSSDRKIYCSFTPKSYI
jgi:hypothetical protein